jgi:DNA polymerase elongation subunit (family B)
VQEPRIVFFDIETVPDLQAALENWCDLSSNRPGKKPTMTASVCSVICFGYRVLGESKARAINAWDFPSWKHDVNDDSALLAQVHEVLKGADAIVTFNGKGFDWRFVQTRMKKHKLDFLPKLPHIDLCQVARSNLFLLNSRLKTVAKYLLDDSKLEHDGWSLWVDTHGGVKRKRDLKAEAKMSKYNLKDVDLMVPLYKELRPLIPGIPNHNLFNPMRDKCCPRCGSTRLKNEGTRVTSTRRYKRYICHDCRGWCHVDIKDELPR